MVKAGVYSATYSNIPVYEFQFGDGLKEHVMRRRHDDWINATHILKAAGFDKPARTRILEREVQKEVHEKVQGGYGKYQGTWVPLEHGQALAHRNGVFEKLRMIFEFVPGNDSPPPAPKHTTNKPKVPKKPAVPKFHSKPVPAARMQSPDNYDNISSQLNDDETPDDMTVASASFMGDDDRYDVSQQSTGHRKRKRDVEHTTSLVEQNHLVYSDELLDYFMTSQRMDEPANRPEPPPDFQPNWVIDNENHTAMHWACAMGDIEIIKQLKRFNADLTCRNIRGETPLMRSVQFTNCQDKQSMPRVAQELITTIEAVDYCQSTAIHHAAAITSSRQKHQCARYYLDVILNKLSELSEQEDLRRILDMQDVDGNTAIHIAAKNKARKCVRALIGRGASTDIRNQDGITAEDLIQQLNVSRQERSLAVSSSPFGGSHRGVSAFQEPAFDPVSRRTVSHHSEAAMSVESKVTPMILEKFNDLAKSFDDELIDRDNSEKEAKRILNSTQLELATVREQIAALELEEEDDDDRMREEAELARIRSRVISMVEQQQQLILATSIKQEESTVNGYGMHEEANLEVKLELFKKFEDEQARRTQLVEQYVDALALAGMSEKGEVYRRLIARCLKLPEAGMDEQIGDLLAAMEENVEVVED